MRFGGAGGGTVPESRRAAEKPEACAKRDALVNNASPTVRVNISISLATRAPAFVRLAARRYLTPAHQLKRHLL
jgi:hypothetical protein